MGTDKLKNKEQTTNEEAPNAGMTRRELLQYLASTFIIGAIALKVGVTIRKYVEANSDSRGRETPGNMENIKKCRGLETVLQASLMHEIRGLGTMQDNLLDPFEITRQFLGGKFWYTGLAQEGDGHYESETIHRFAVIGDRSKFLDKDGNGKERSDTTSFADAINTLLDYERLTDREITNWIVFTYKRSFNMELYRPRIVITREASTKRITHVAYIPEDGFEEKVKLSYPKEIKGVSGEGFQKKWTASDEYYPILGKNHELLMQSGLSPVHDLNVPASLLQNKWFAVPITADTQWRLNTDDLSNVIQDFRNRKNNEAKGAKIILPNGDESNKELCLTMVPLEDKYIAQLAEYLTRGLNGDPKLEIQALTDFVQGLKYIGENDTDINRPPMATIFNGGGDCNNLAVLWSALMASRKHPHALYHLYGKGYVTAGHICGGVKLPGAKRYSLVELTSKVPIGAVGVGDNNKITAVEILEREGNEWKISHKTILRVVGETK